MPTPPATSSTSRRVRRAAVSAPYGPSASSRVPGSSRGRRVLPSPSVFTVRRRWFGAGGADRENGWAGRPEVGGEEAPAEELARLGAHSWAGQRLLAVPGGGGPAPAA